MDLLPTRQAIETYLAAVAPEIRLGDYLAKGGSAVVYTLTGTDPAEVVKVIDTRYMAATAADGEFARNRRNKIWKYIQNEIQVMRELKDCPHIMQIHRQYIISDPDGTGEDTLSSSAVAVQLIVMPKLKCLMDYTMSQSLSENEVIRLALDIGQALSVCASHCVIHRDVKPANIFVKVDPLRFILGDFGTSRRVENLKDLCVTNYGTDVYLAPEIRQGKPLRYFNSDIYSLGVTLFYLLSGGRFPAFDHGSKLNRICNMPDVSEDLAEVLTKMLQQDSENRYHSPELLLKDLQALPLRNRQGVPQQYAIKAKQCMLDGKYDQAMDYAKKGAHEEKNCERILAYCMYRQARNDKKVLDKVQSILNKLYLDEDVGGVFLRGMVYGHQKKHNLFLMDIKEAAQKGNVPAMYYYGKALYSGMGELCPQDREQGTELLFRAAEAEFYPALRVVKRMQSADPYLHMPESLKKMMEQEYPADPQKEKEAIVRFL